MNNHNHPQIIRGVDFLNQHLYLTLSNFTFQLFRQFHNLIIFYYWIFHSAWKWIFHWIENQKFIFNKQITTPFWWSEALKWILDFNLTLLSTLVSITLSVFKHTFEYNVGEREQIREKNVSNLSIFVKNSVDLMIVMSMPSPAYF